MKKLKRIIFINILLFIFTSCLPSQTIDEETIRQIREDFNSLYNKKDSFKREIIDFNGYTSQGGLLYVYYDSNILQFLTLYLFSERGKTEFKIYPLRNKSVFLNRIENFYEESIYEGPVNIIGVKEDYFLIKDEVEYDVTSKEIKKSTNDLVELTNEIFLIIK